MSRSAIFASLAFHAGLLFLVGWRSSWTAARIGSGHPGADASFFADDAVGALVVIVPAGPSEPDPIRPPPAAILISPPLTTNAAAPLQLPGIAGAPHGIPAAKGSAAPSKNGKATHRGQARSVGSAGDQRGSGAGAAAGGGRLAGYVPPQFLIRYKPLYPEEARAQRLEGTVLLLVAIDAAGHVTSTNLQRSCGHAVLDRAALAAVRSWRFDPARQDGVAIAAQVEIPIRFRFEERTTHRA